MALLFVSCAMRIRHNKQYNMGILHFCVLCYDTKRIVHHLADVPTPFGINPKRTESEEKQQMKNERLDVYGYKKT